MNQFFKSTALCLLLIGGVALSQSVRAESSAPSFLFFAPGSTTSPDGRYTLAAYKLSEDNFQYYFVSPNALSGALEIKSDAIFEAYSNAPDIRGYGPRKSAWSQRRVEDIGNSYTTNGWLYGEIVATLYESRKFYRLAVHQFKDGKIVSTDFNQEALENQAQEYVAKKLSEDGHGENLHISRQMTGIDFVTDNGGGKYESDLWPTFDLEDGRLIMLEDSYWVSKDENGDNGLWVDCQLIAKLSLDAQGVLQVNTVSIKTVEP